MSKKFTLRLDDNLSDTIDRIAKEQGFTKSDLVQYLMTHSLGTVELVLRLTKSDSSYCLPITNSNKAVCPTPAVPDNSLSLFSIWDQLVGDGNRPYLGKLIKENGIEEVGRAVMQMVIKPPANPIAYVGAIFKKKKRGFVA
jgi:hypothetical protein|tara:strand:- start:2707 stop:3129 length:423 start_codon:yes stop_codon:yes gene_type:complete